MFWPVSLKDLLLLKKAKKIKDIQLQNRKTPKARKLEKNRQQIGAIFCQFFSYFPLFFLYMLPVCLPTFWIWGYFSSVAGRRNRHFRAPTDAPFPKLKRQFVWGCSFFACDWKLLAYSGAFLLTVDNFSFFTYNLSFFTYNFSFFTYSWSFLAYSGKVRLISALRDCKRRSLIVSKNVPTVSKKASFFDTWHLFHAYTDRSPTPSPWGSLSSTKKGKRPEHCFKSTVLEERTHWVLKKGLCRTQRSEGSYF